MKWSKWLENWDMTSLKINLKFLESKRRMSPTLPRGHRRSKIGA